MRTATSCTEDRYCSTPLQQAPDERHRLSPDVCPCNDVHLRGEPDRIVAFNYATVADSRRLPRSEVRSSSPDWGKQHNLQLFGQHVRISDYTTTDALARREWDSSDRRLDPQLWQRFFAARALQDYFRPLRESVEDPR
jgi:hypothetical protein